MDFKKGDRIVSNDSFCRGQVWYFEREYIGMGRSSSSNGSFYIKDSEGKLFLALKEWGWELECSAPTIMDSSEYEEILSCQDAYRKVIR